MKRVARPLAAAIVMSAARAAACAVAGPASHRAQLGLQCCRYGWFGDERLRLAPLQPVTWPDGALGCPQKGMLYTQPLVPGWRISIEVPNAAALNYHANQRGGWVWCPSGRATPALPESPDSRR